MPLIPGSRLGPYEILTSLGAGGMGEVYRARDPRLAREVAIKVIVSEHAKDPERVRRFTDEARAAGALSHPNVLSVFDTGLCEGSPYLVLELLEGETLRQLLQRGPLPPRKAIEIAVETCRGLAAAHEKGIVHRDLKPDNLFLARDGRLKILDFGLAKLGEAADASGDGARTATLPGLIIGTLAYMSPEQARGESADARSDIFALGAVLYEMLSGRGAFLRPTPAETLSAILAEDPKEIDPATGRILRVALVPIVRRCLEKDPGQRFQSARDLGYALEVLSGSASDGEVRARSSQPWGRALRLSLIAGALAVGAATTYVWLRSGGGQTAPLAVVPFTAFRGQEVAPSFSPDGSQIAFAWTGEEESREDHFDLYVKVIGGDAPLRLTRRPAEWMSAAWSPDGRRIAFSRSGKDGRGIYVVPALGGAERKLVDVAHENFDFVPNTLLSWSPDGKLLAFTDLDVPLARGNAVSLLNVETMEKRALPPPAPRCWSVWMPVFSPDGRSVAVACQLILELNELFVMPVDGGSARSIAVVPGTFTGLAWGGDGKHLFFTCSGSIWRVSVGGGDAEKVMAGRDAQLLALSRGGDRLAYTQTIVNTSLWRLRLAGPLRAAGAPERAITSSRGQRHAAFSPDGRRVAFESTRSGAQEVWTSGADGSDPVRMSSFGGALTGSPRWSPDGRRIVFDSRASGEAVLHLVDVDGGPPRRFATGIRESQQPAWSPDGKWLYFDAPVEEVNQVFRIPAEGGEAAQITRKGGIRANVSPDGRRVYYVNPQNEIWSASAGGGDERPVPGMPRRSFKWYADWALGPSGIYFIDGDPPRPGVHFIDYTRQRPIRLADIPGRPETWGGGLALSPDGRSLLYTQIDAIDSDIMLVEGFR